jgi:threonylcarbamoyladenosine tRNA methylthiotransferase MtaB
VVGNSRKDDISAILDTSDNGVFHGALDNAGVALDMYGVASADVAAAGRTRLAVKIQEGCDRACSYCIVPRLRGPSRSVPSRRILDACVQAGRAGIAEIVVTGTHIGQYQGETAGYGLDELIDDMLAVAPADFRIRLSSLNPADLSPKLAQKLGSQPRLCDHIHVSVQSLCPQVLLAMNRSPGDVEMLALRLAELRAQRPHTAVGADFIVGFPGETEEMFQATMAGVKALQFAYGHVFRYSRRPHTAAAVLAGQVSEAEKTRRSKQLRALLSSMRRQFIERQYGLTHTIVVERDSPMAGLTSNYIRIEAAQARARQGSRMSVVLTEYDEARNLCAAVAACQGAA